MSDRNTSTRRGASLVGLIVLAVVFVVIGIFVGQRMRLHEDAASIDSAAPHSASTDTSKTTTSNALWTCSMHPQVIQDHPGLCPICHMALTPLDTQSRSGGLVVDPTVIQSMGVRTVRVTRQKIARAIRAVGTLVEREGDHRDVNLRVSGWVQSLYANTDGMSVVEGAPLFDLYSPELSVAIEELIAARKQRDSSGTAAHTLSDTLYSTSRKRVELMGLSASEVDRLATLDSAPPTVTFTSPVAGHMVEKTIYAGAAVKAGDRAMRIADNHTLWVDARVFERDFGAIQAGAEVRVHVDAYPAESFVGHVLFVHPHLDMESRTALVRAEIDNASMRLREGMYATVEIDTQGVADALVVPRECILDTGTRQIAFLALAGGKFEPREVAIGARGDGGIVQVVSGLALNDEVVASGQYLLDSESRMREAVRKFLAPGATTATRGAESTPKHDDTSSASAPRRVLPHPEWTAEIDAVFSAYLQLADALGAVETSDKALDASPFANAARVLADRARASDAEAFTAELAKNAQTLVGATLVEQRRAFKATGEAAIELALALAPSTKVAKHLYVMRCTMAPGRWMQATPDVHNPFYGTSMKECGELVRTLDAQRSDVK